MLTHTPWEEIDWPDEDQLRQLMVKEGLAPQLWTADNGFRFDVHTHDYHKVVCCLEGSIWFTFPDDPDNVIELEPGDRLDLPAGIRHAALTGMDGVACLEARKD